MSIYIYLTLNSETNTRLESMMVILILQTGKTQKLQADTCVGTSLAVFFRFRWADILKGQRHLEFFQDRKGSPVKYTANIACYKAVS